MLNPSTQELNKASGSAADGDAVSPRIVVSALFQRWKLLVLGPMLVGAIALGVAFVIPPTFTARTTFLPPQVGQSAVAAALASLGPLAALAGGAGPARSPGEQYVAMMQSATVSDRIIDRFNLMELYDVKYREDARRSLLSNVRIMLGRKDGLISVDVDDRLPRRAADIANQYVEELRQITASLALSEAQQRRAFFEGHLKRAQERLVAAQQALQTGGFNAGALKAEPKAAAESYARLRADVTAAEVRLQVMRGSLTDAAPEVRQQLAMLSAMRSKLASVEQTSDVAAGADYVTRYRDFKYQEALFELYARQFELARVDESREGTLIQVVDIATPPERRSAPRRTLIGLVALGVTFVLLAMAVMARTTVRVSQA